MNFKKIFFKNKNFKLAYYLSNYFRDALPQKLFINYKSTLDTHQDILNNPQFLDRLNYYNKLSTTTPLLNSQNPLTYNSYEMPQKSRVYYHDIRRYLKYFDPNTPFLYCPGDNIKILPSPHFVKSRPIKGSENEVLLKLNAIRHFNFIKDDIPFTNKASLLFGRLSIYQDIRKRFYELHYDNPMCDIGDVGHGEEMQWKKQKVSINSHLKYKYILALEGNDVATNLKWIMSSNSIAVMPQPKYETWYMEGRLIPDHHYICIKDDFSDLNDRLEYFNRNTDHALEIIKNAQLWTAQFKDEKTELLLNLKVMEKYFERTRPLDNV